MNPFNAFCETLLAFHTEAWLRVLVVAVSFFFSPCSSFPFPNLFYPLIPLVSVCLFHRVFYCCIHCPLCCHNVCSVFRRSLILLHSKLSENALTVTVLYNLKRIMCVLSTQFDYYTAYSNVYIKRHSLAISLLFLLHKYYKYAGCFSWITWYIYSTFYI